MNSNNVAIAYFSGYGHTLELANAVRDGVESVPDTDSAMVKRGRPNRDRLGGA